SVDGSDHLPRLPRAYVPRKRLWRHLESAADSAAVLVVGPGGAGKTLGVVGWLRESGRTEGAAWVRADSTWTPERLLPLLRPDRLVVVDDAHQLPLATIRALDARLDTAPESMRLLLISRWDLPFTRLTAELFGHFTVLRGELLRLDEDESTALVAAHVSTQPSEVARVIADRTQGWCGAVVMTARAVATATDPVALAQQYAAEGLAVADRVASEVFATLQPRQRHLLLCVSTEPVVTPRLAVHLTRDPQAGQALAELEATGLLVTRLPATEHPDAHDPDVAHQPRYAIHPLLAEVARRRIAAGGDDVQRATATVQRAVRLDVDRGVTADAFRRLIAIGDHLGAADLLATVGLTLLLRGEAAGVHAWATAHPSAVDLAPGSWFALAVERWFAGPVGRAQHWLDRILNDPMPVTTATDFQQAAARLMRAQLGLEPATIALEHALTLLGRDERPEADALEVWLRCEVAVVENWLGRLEDAAESFRTVLQVGRSRNLEALRVVALSHLAFTELLSGRESTARGVADEAIATATDRGQGWSAPYAHNRAVLVRDLALFVDAPAHDLSETISATLNGDAELLVHAGDPLSRFWHRMRRARLELARGSLARAERALATPIETPALPEHLWAALVLERAFLAALAKDGAALAEAQELLQLRGLVGEAAYVAGLCADLRGDRRDAACAFETAADGARCTVPPIRAMALVGAAQLRHELDEAAPAGDLMHQAIIATEVRRNAMPFLGWTRHGTAVRVLLDQQARRHATPWTGELLGATRTRSSIATHFGPTTAAPGERLTVPAGTIAPVLSPRERDVLHELARGSTYADIAANLFVSENTVKTHVSSLYGKLSVNRRSAALAAARTMHLL
ncbi:MAG: LuxR C-terminal-related transcriptional regulator, partial [Nocardioides sp.]